MTCIKDTLLLICAMRNAYFKQNKPHYIFIAGKKLGMWLHTAHTSHIAILDRTSAFCYNANCMQYIN